MMNLCEGELGSAFNGSGTVIYRTYVKGRWEVHLMEVGR